MALALLLMLPWMWMKLEDIGAAASSYSGHCSRSPRLLLSRVAALEGTSRMSEQTYTITVTGTSGSLIRSTTAPL